MGAHDALFKRMFEDPARAAGELRAVLPESILQAVDLASLRHVSESFVDDALADRHVDLLFEGRLATDEPVLVYFVFEHQSEPHPKMPWRFLVYMVRIWERCTREDPASKLPLIIPLLVHHGEGGWTAPRHLHELVAGTDAFPQMRRFVPQFEILLDDLVHRTDEDLAGRALDDGARLTLWFLRDARDFERMLAHLDVWMDLLASRLDPDAPADDRTALLSYLWESLGRANFEQMKERLVRRVPRTEKTMESMADYLRREGREAGRQEGLEEGRQEGLEEGKRETLRRLLELKFGAPSQEIADRITRAAMTELDAFLERFLTATRPEDVVQ